MTVHRAFSCEILAAQLVKLEKVASIPARYVIAYSGGLDSTVLAHALSELRRTGKITTEIHAIHIDHGLHDKSMEWSRHCASQAAAMEIGFQSMAVKVAKKSGKGLEGAARDARYSALQSRMRDGDWLLSAHHSDDQAETLLLNLIRGSGPAGIAAIGEIRRFGSGWLARPMIGCQRSAIERYAIDAKLDWIEDPSNTDRSFDRNFLRHEVLPTMKQRWPDVVKRLRRSAAHAGEASQLLNDLAASDVENLGTRPDRLPVDQLIGLSPARQRNLIRYALNVSGLPAPTTVQLQKVVDEVILAREDAQPIVTWSGAKVRRYRNSLYLLPDHLVSGLKSAPVCGGQVDLGGDLGILRLVHGARLGVSEDLVESGLRIEARVGGEEFRPVGQAHTRKLKKLLQEEGVVPWMRDRLPLVYAGSQLVAVGDLWLAADAVSQPGVAVQWSGRPALH